MWKGFCLLVRPVGSGGEFEGVRTNPLLGFKRFYTSPTYALPFVSSPLASLPLRIIAITALTPVQWHRVYLCNTKDVDLIVFLCVYMCMFLLCSSLFLPFPTWGYLMMIDCTRVNTSLFMGLSYVISHGNMTLAKLAYQMHNQSLVLHAMVAYASCAVGYFAYLGDVVR